MSPVYTPLIIRIMESLLILIVSFIVTPYIKGTDLLQCFSVRKDIDNQYILHVPLFSQIDGKQVFSYDSPVFRIITLPLFFLKPHSAIPTFIDRP